MTRGVRNRKKRQNVGGSILADFCTWCREYIVNKNQECRECEGCLKCQHFDQGCCTNVIVVQEYKMEWNRPDRVLGVGPPLCRKYCPHLSLEERRRASLLFEGEREGRDRTPSSEGEFNVEEVGAEKHAIVITPIPKFWLNGDHTCYDFTVDFSETVYYHLTLLGWCEWEIPEHIVLVIKARSK